MSTSGADSKNIGMHILNELDRHADRAWEKEFLQNGYPPYHVRDRSVVITSVTRLCTKASYHEEEYRETRVQVGDVVKALLSDNLIALEPWPEDADPPGESTEILEITELGRQRLHVVGEAGAAEDRRAHQLRDELAGLRDAAQNYAISAKRWGVLAAGAAIISAIAACATYFLRDG